MIRELSIRGYSEYGADSLSIEHPCIVIFIGPNNSGKSLILQEITSECKNPDNDYKVLRRLTFDHISESEADEELEGFIPDYKNKLDKNNFISLSFGDKLVTGPPEEYIIARVNPNIPEDAKPTDWQRRRIFTSWYAKHRILDMHGERRLSIVYPQERGDLKKPIGSFARLLTNDPKRAELRSLVHEAFDIWIGFDSSEGSILQLRFGQTEPVGERTIEDETLNWMADALTTDEVSDGVKAFAGILIELIAGDHKVVTIDEPEAFLHPSLSFKLGKEAVKVARKYGKQIFVATHSPHFLMGAIQSGTRVDIVRLTYDGFAGSANYLDLKDLRNIIRKPLLRSANTLSGLFYRSVIVTEADADRAFYNEINERLLDQADSRGNENCLYLNAYGKDSIHEIVKPLRAMGIAAACIADIDVTASPQPSGHLTLVAM